MLISNERIFPEHEHYGHEFEVLFFFLFIIAANDNSKIILKNGYL